MIEMVGRVKKDVLTNQLLDYLMGEDDYGEPKDPIYTYKVIYAFIDLQNFESVQIGLQNSTYDLKLRTGEWGL
jgi:hypothetical protein